MEVVSRILRNTRSFVHQFRIIEILLLLNKDEEQQKKYEYIYKKNLVMLEDIDNYERLSKDEDAPFDVIHILYNQITNDNETIKALLEEVKEDLYRAFPTPAIVLLDNTQTEELEVLQDNLMNLMANGKTSKDLSSYVEACGGIDIKPLLNHLLSYISLYSDEKTKRLLPIKFFENYLENQATTYEEFSQMYNNVKFTIKYMTHEDMVLLDVIKREFVLLITYYFILILNSNLGLNCRSEIETPKNSDEVE